MFSREDYRRTYNIKQRNKTAKTILKLAKMFLIFLSFFYRFRNKYLIKIMNVSGEVGQKSDAMQIEFH